MKCLGISHAKPSSSEGSVLFRQLFALARSETFLQTEGPLYSAATGLSPDFGSYEDWGEGFRYIQTVPWVPLQGTYSISGSGVEPNGAVRFSEELGTEGGIEYNAISFAEDNTEETGGHMALETLITRSARRGRLAFRGQLVEAGRVLGREWEGVITNAVGRMTHLDLGVGRAGRPHSAGGTGL